MKFDKGQILKNVGSSWFALGVNVLVGIFLSPYILHRLGDEAFGIWILIFSITGYYGLFDLGIRSSIVRYVARYSAVNDGDELNRLINTAMFSYSGIGAVALVITLTVTYYVTSIFKIPPEFVVTARWLLLMVGTAVSLGFPLGVFGGILDGLQRFYLMNVTSVSATLLRALLIVLALRHGGGLLSDLIDSLSRKRYFSPGVSAGGSDGMPKARHSRAGFACIHVVRRFGHRRRAQSLMRHA